MVMSSVFFIVAFTAVQLNNTMSSITTYNTFRAKLGAFAAHNALITIAPKIQAGGIDAVKLVEETLQPLMISEVLERAQVIRPDSDLSPVDKRRMDQVKTGDKDNWLYFFIDQEQKEVSIFVTFLPGDAYVVKLTYSLGNIAAAFRQIYNPIIFTIILTIAANIVLAVLLSRVIVTPVRKLHGFTKTIASGDLASKVLIKTDDEFEDLGDAFNYMSVELGKMRERAENANPLTKLPGNIVIMEEVDKRIKGDKKFVVLYSDLNNFKAYNDKYGIHKGDEAIKMTAEVMKSSVREKGNADDLVGHEGGDDFVVVTTPDRAQEVADTIISNFNEGVKSLYDPKDIEQGFFISHNRSGEVQKFPIMGISLAGATNAHRPIASYGEVTNICAEVKKKAKAKGSSAYVLDVRT